MTPDSQFIIRELWYDDLNRVTDIDEAVIGQRRPAYWRHKFEVLLSRPPAASLVVEADGMVVGFMFGNVSGWEFGVPENIGWIEIVGVDPRYQRKGVAARLFEAIVEQFKGIGVTRVYTVVNDDDDDMLGFFNGMGFSRARLVSLQKEI